MNKKRLLTVLGGSGWTPIKLGTNLKLWLDLSDITTLFQDAARTTPITANDDPIGGVADKSGLGNHASSSLTARPLYKTNIQNGLGVARFDATDDNLSLGAMAIDSGGYTAIFVHSGPAAKVNDTSYLMDSKLGRIIFADRGGSGTSPFTEIEWFDGTWHNIAEGIEGWQLNVFDLIEGGNGTIYRNGISLGSAPYTAKAFGTETKIGTRYDGTKPFFSGDIGEVIICQPPLSVSNRNLVTKYINSKWGI